ncbi:peptidase domain-containing ABC transporter [Yeosuana sp.]|uniref:peptidase domain-containing ABC transporter n=1 Tax=Yeosuana sp. TaxID=2529388 RepID=UPI0040551485
MTRRKFPHFFQSESKDCGPTCLKIISKFYGKIIPIQKLRDLSETTREGSNLSGLLNSSEAIGFRALPVKIDFKILLLESPLPCIVHWDKTHYVVVYKIKNDRVYISDPGFGLIKYDSKEFIKRWIGLNANSSTKDGIALLLEPTKNFYENEWDIENNNVFKFISVYFFRYKKYIVQLILGIIATSLITAIFPFLTQSLVDIGVQNKNLDFIYLILLAQIFLFIGKISFDILRSWILLHISTRINISMISDFFIKLMKLPAGYFDTKMTGDLMQRIGDHYRIENFLTNHSLSLLFSMLNLIIFSLILLYFSSSIFLIFITGSVVFFLWIFIFQKKRREIDSKRFIYASKEQSKVMELINGMQEIKLHNAETSKRIEWEFVQIKLFKIKIKTLSLEQAQDTGANLINELKNIFITFLSATLVINGKITLGMMLSIQYILGQLNSPLLQFMDFIRAFQDGKISSERLMEIHNKKEEEKDLNESFETANINVNNLSYRYPGYQNFVLKNVSFNIPINKVTAIVGTSGGGKTTLLKILLKFYEINSNNIKIGNVSLNSISSKAWRQRCGVVMQEGYIFNDTIARNIAIGVDNIDKKRLSHAVEIANIKNHIESLPLLYNTVIGSDGVGLSSGQKQRILIARAVYKNPDYLFFDEATSALDANNEKTIMEKLEKFFKNKTVVIIAHRLSTVKNADQIIVMNQGNIIEIGKHDELIEKRGEYYILIKNQLELGN